jgi:hypothetical protein
MRSVLLILLLLLSGDIISHPVLTDTGNESEGIKSPLYIGGKVHYGFIIPHAEDLKAVSEANIWGFQLDISKLGVSPKAWSNCNCYSRLGFSFDFFDYRNPDILGHSYSLAFFFEPYFNFKSRSRLSLRAGLGLTYLDKVYNEISNPENLFYSSKISGLLLLNLSYNYVIKDQYQLNFALNYNHISNAGAKMPNKGMNFPTVSLGLDYIIRPRELKSQEKSAGLGDKKVLKFSRMFWSLRSIDEDSMYERTNHLMIGLEAGMIKSLSNINGLLGGIEFSYDGSFQELSDRMEENYSPFVVSLHFGHAFVIGRITFTQQMAWYVYRPFPSVSESFFQRYGIYYRIGKIINVGFSLKAHGHVAEHMDMRIGVEF